MGLPENSDSMTVSLDYCDTVNSNIDLFLKDKSNKITIALENIDQGFTEFWNLINAEGDIKSALAEFSNKYNSTREPQQSNKMTFYSRIARKLRRLRIKFPGYMNKA
jgi:hypothetical protein